MKQPTACLIIAVVLATLAVRAEVVDIESLLLPLDHHRNQAFGYSVAVSGDTAVIGAPDDGIAVGAAYVYNKVGSNWIQTQKLVPPQATSNDLVGISVAVENDLLALGAPGITQGASNRVGNPGVVYLFQRDTNGLFQPQGFLAAPDGQRNARFGVSIAMSQGSMVIGASRHSDFGSTNNGSIYIFDFTAIGWQLAAKVTANDLTNNSNFGQRVAMDGNRLIVGAANSLFSTGTPFRVTTPGAAYIYRRIETNQYFRPWIEEQKLVPTNAVASDQFGYSVALNRDTALVGAPFSPSGGSVYAYVRTDTNWLLQAQLGSSNLSSTNVVFTNLVSSSVTNGDNFGFSVSMLGTLALIGAPGTSSNDLSRLGATYIFEQVDTNWFEQQQLFPLQTADNFQFGFSTAIGPVGMIVGAASAQIGRGTGAAYAFSASQSIVSIVSAKATPAILVPEDRRLVPVTITIETTGTNVTSRIIAVSSNQSIVGVGANADSPDWVITGDLTLLLRAEADDNFGIDRIYNIVVQATDTLGNTATTVVRVIVPASGGGIATVPAVP